jgi:Ca-activated chloride channel family protein
VSWSSPLALIALVAVPAAVALFVWAAVQRREALHRFAGRQGASAHAAARQRRWQAALVAVAVFCLAVALAGPRYGTQLREVQQEGLDVIIALDVSESMRAEDVAPSRLARAKYEINELLDDFAGSRVGLIVFAGEAFLQCPLTSDFGAVRLFLDAAGPQLIPTQGTDFEEALRVAAQAFDTAEGGPDFVEDRARALLVISDGENHEGGFGPTLTTLQAAGVAVFAAGVGGTEGAPIPVYRQGRLVGYKTDRNGQTVQTTLHESSLRDLVLDGAYYRIGRTGSDLPQITAALARLDRSVVATETFEAYAEQYQWPLAVGLFLLLVERFVAVRRPTSEPVA